MNEPAFEHAGPKAEDARILVIIRASLTRSLTAQLAGCVDNKAGLAVGCDRSTPFYAPVRGLAGDHEALFIVDDKEEPGDEAKAAFATWRNDVLQHRSLDAGDRLAERGAQCQIERARNRKYAIGRIILRIVDFAEAANPKRKTPSLREG